MKTEYNDRIEYYDKGSCMKHSFSVQYLQKIEYKLKKPCVFHLAGNPSKVNFYRIVFQQFLL